MTISAGDLLVGDNRRTVRIVGEFSDVSEIKDIIVKSEFQKPHKSALLKFNFYILLA
jgi:rRNA processing protein Krr1/Pno1